MDQGLATAPVKVSISVDASLERAFDVFTRDLGSWWPVATHSIEEEKTAVAVMERRAGGRIFERHEDGSEADWGTVTVWEPPGRVVFTWNPSYEERPLTEVEVTFTAEGAGTRVDLEHRGWERLGDRAGELREGYSTGWAYLLGECYAPKAS